MDGTVVCWLFSGAEHADVDLPQGGAASLPGLYPEPGVQGAARPHVSQGISLEAGRVGENQAEDAAHAVPPDVKMMGV